MSKKMTIKTLKTYLRKNNYAFKSVNGELVVTHQGPVYLRSLTTLPDGVKFENQGYVYLSSQAGTVLYCGKSLLVRNIDNYTMSIYSSHDVDGVTISKAAFFYGGPIEDWESCFIASIGEYHAHGSTVREAIDDVNFKYAQETGSIDDVIQKVRESKKVTVSDYRLITGACKMGVKRFMADNNIPDDTEFLPLEDVLKLTKHSFGGEKMQKIFK